jgi:hypothetical protein
MEKSRYLSGGYPELKKDGEAGTSAAPAVIIRNEWFPKI